MDIDRLQRSNESFRRLVRSRPGQNHSSAMATLDKLQNKGAPLSSAETELVTEKMADLLVGPGGGINDISACRPFLPQVMEIIFQRLQSSTTNEQQTILERAFCISHVVLCLRPDIGSRLAELFRQCHLSPLDCLRRAELGKEESEKRRVCALLRSSYRLLEYDERTFISALDWSPIVRYYCHPCIEIRYYAARTLSILLSISDDHRETWLMQLGVQSSESPGISDAEKRELTEIELRESSLTKRLRMEVESAFHLETTGNREDEEGTLRGSCNNSSEPCLSLEVLGDVVRIGGISIRRRRHNKSDCSIETPNGSMQRFQQSEGLVHVDSTLRNLHSLALSLNEDRPILLEGPPGCGKSALIREIAKLTNNHEGFVELHLDDQLDSKTLLGSYVCTEVPGEFCWQPGVLAHALREGRWVVIEDVDKAPAEVLAALRPLIETKCMPLSNRGEVLRAKDGFQLFATRTTPPTHSFLAGARRRKRTGGSALAAGGLSEDHWSVIDVKPLTEIELVEIIRSRFPDLPTNVAPLMVNTFMKMSSTEGPSINEENSERLAHSDAEGAQSRTTSSSLARYQSLFSARDLLKWVKRVDVLGHIHRRESTMSVSKKSESRPEGHEVFLTEAERLSIVCEAVDIFCAGIPQLDVRSEAAQMIGRFWQLRSDIVLRRCFEEKPLVDGSLSEGGIIGRVALNRFGVSDGYEEITRSKDNHGPDFAEDGSRVSKSRDAPSAGRGSATFAHTGHALRLMERVAAAAALREPILLVGETGCGKTTVVQHVAASLQKRLVVQNLNVQTDSSDLLGGYRPVDSSQLARPLYETFNSLFRSTFSERKNAAFLLMVEQAFLKENWAKLAKGMTKAVRMAEKKFDQSSGSLKRKSPMTKVEEEHPKGDDTPSNKERRRGVSHEGPNDCRREWKEFANRLARFTRQWEQVKNSFAFAFVEGALVKALREGHWVLLDEINLASAETLQRLCSLLESKDGSLALTEKGDIEPVQRHPGFRLFAAMNPSTDVGKKDLPPGLRHRFTEIYVDEMEDPNDLQLVTMRYLGEVPGAPVAKVVEVYLQLRKLSSTSLVDGARRRPRYSLRSLCRALEASRVFLSRGYGLPRSLFDGFAVSFATQLDDSSKQKVEAILWKAFAQGLRQKDLSRPPPRPGGRSIQSSEMHLVTSYWLPAGPGLPVDGAEPDSVTGLRQFVLTPSVENTLRNLCRAVSCQKYPILLQGPTSAGKTSIVEYLAARTGHKCVRINNHEHTDLQEYMGSYTTSTSSTPVEHDLDSIAASQPVGGTLRFQPGVLVDAVRFGWWLVLDELNLAPSEVLEALNRLLDDNRELFIPETQEVVKPHPSFMLFATQNPAGAYGGRKELSKAFRNRFLELQVSEMPGPELVSVLNERCGLPASHGEKLVSVMRELQARHASSSVFQGKDGFITTRDLLRWAERRPPSKFALAAEGYLLLGERLRRKEEKDVVRAVIEKCIGVPLNLDTLYQDLEEEEKKLDEQFSESKKRMATQESCKSKKSTKKDKKGRKACTNGTPAKTCVDDQETSGFSMLDSAPSRTMDKVNAKFLGTMQQLQYLQRLLSSSQNGLHGSDSTSESTSRAVSVSAIGVESVACTSAMRRLFALVGRCLQNKEPVLLVGATGSGKTTVCQLYSVLLQRELQILNCHQHTETSDLLGGLRPARGREEAQKLIREKAVEIIMKAQQTGFVDDRDDMKSSEEGVGGKKDVQKHNSEDSVGSDTEVQELDAVRASLGSTKQLSELPIQNLVDQAHEVTQRIINTPEDEWRALKDEVLAKAGEIRRLRRQLASLFEWTDGPLVSSLRRGDLLLLDEISLAEDAVLERLNSVLEPKRSLLLAEKGGSDNDEAGNFSQGDGSKSTNNTSDLLIIAHEDWRILATMNPGGDFGKRELSPALRNRFTEIYIPAVSDLHDILMIVEARMATSSAKTNSALSTLVKPMVVFVAWFNEVSQAVANGTYKPPPHGVGSAESVSTQRSDFGESPKDDSASVMVENPTSVEQRLFGGETGDRSFDSLVVREGLSLTLRDILGWVTFLKTVVGKSGVEPWLAFVHGAAMVALDGMGIGAGWSSRVVNKVKKLAHIFLLQQVPTACRDEAARSLALNHAESLAGCIQYETEQKTFGIAPFFIPRGDREQDSLATSSEVAGRDIVDGGEVETAGADQMAPEERLEKKKKMSTGRNLSYAFSAPTTAKNLLRLLRALQLSKPVLLEGSPGAGKTSLIAAVAKAAGHRLVRINLSDQSDVVDLFGSDLPVPETEDDLVEANENESSVIGSKRDTDGRYNPNGGGFAWADGVFLRAVKRGDWVLLDELNLAPAPVLEALNSALDHRGCVYVPELDKTFVCPPSFRVFAAQNPLYEGGGRKGLPASFLNRFTKVFVDPLDKEDFLHAAKVIFPGLHNPELRAVNTTMQEIQALSALPHPRSLSFVGNGSPLSAMINFVYELRQDTEERGTLGRKGGGGPWEFNFRDVFRWCKATERSKAADGLLESEHDRSGIEASPATFVDHIFVQRMRTAEDREHIGLRCKEIVGRYPSRPSTPIVRSTPSHLQIGAVIWAKGDSGGTEQFGRERSKRGWRQPLVNDLEPGLQAEGVSPVLLRALLRPMEALLLGVAHQWPCLLVGPEASGKTMAVRALANMAGKRLREVSLTSGTDASDLLGGFEQRDLRRRLNKIIAEILKRLRAASASALRASASARTKISNDADLRMTSAVQLMLNLQSKLRQYSENDCSEGSTSSSSTDSGVSSSDITHATTLCEQALTLLRTHIADENVRRDVDSLGARLRNLKVAARVEHSAVFEWVDGALVQAVEAGDWLLLDNVNLCNGSVLDRLNALMEPGGELLISECGTKNGTARIVKPHPEFRAFLALDPHRGGEISRAMRNRCLEIFFPAPEIDSESSVVWQTLRQGPSRLPETGGSAEQLSPVSAFDGLALVNASGVSSLPLAAAMVAMHTELCIVHEDEVEFEESLIGIEEDGEGERGTMSRKVSGKSSRSATGPKKKKGRSGVGKRSISTVYLVRWASLVAKLIAQGEVAVHATKLAFAHVYSSVVDTGARIKTLDGFLAKARVKKDDESASDTDAALVPVQLWPGRQCAAENSRGRGSIVSSGANVAASVQYHMNLVEYLFQLSELASTRATVESERQTSGSKYAALASFVQSAGEIAQVPFPVGVLRLAGLLSLPAKTSAEVDIFEKCSVAPPLQVLRFEEGQLLAHYLKLYASEQGKSRDLDMEDMHVGSFQKQGVERWIQLVQALLPLAVKSCLTGGSLRDISYRHAQLKILQEGRSSLMEVFSSIPLSACWTEVGRWAVEQSPEGKAFAVARRRLVQKATALLPVPGDTGDAAREICELLRSFPLDSYSDKVFVSYLYSLAAKLSLEELDEDDEVYEVQGEVEEETICAVGSPAVPGSRSEWSRLARELVEAARDWEESLQLSFSQTCKETGAYREGLEVLLDYAMQGLGRLVTSGQPLSGAKRRKTESALGESITWTYKDNSNNEGDTKGSVPATVENLSLIQRSFLFWTVRRGSLPALPSAPQYNLEKTVKQVLSRTLGAAISGEAAGTQSTAKKRPNAQGERSIDSLWSEGSSKCRQALGPRDLLPIYPYLCALDLYVEILAGAPAGRCDAVAGRVRQVLRRRQQLWDVLAKRKGNETDAGRTKSTPGGVRAGSNSNSSQSILRWGGSCVAVQTFVVHWRWLTKAVDHLVALQEQSRAVGATVGAVASEIEKAQDAQRATERRLRSQLDGAREDVERAMADFLQTAAPASLISTLLPASSVPLGQLPPGGVSSRPDGGDGSAQSSVLTDPATVRLKDRLWKRGGHPVSPSDASLWRAWTEIQRYSAACSLRRGVDRLERPQLDLRTMYRSSHPSLCLDKADREQLVEACATIQWIVREGHPSTSGGAGLGSEPNRRARETWEEKLVAGSLLVLTGLNREPHAGIAAAKNDLGMPSLASPSLTASVEKTLTSAVHTVLEVVRTKLLDRRSRCRMSWRTENLVITNAEDAEDDVSMQVEDEGWEEKEEEEAEHDLWPSLGSEQEEVAPKQGQLLLVSETLEKNWSWVQLTPLAEQWAIRQEAVVLRLIQWVLLDEIVAHERCRELPTEGGKLCPTESKIVVASDERISGLLHGLIRVLVQHAGRQPFAVAPYKELLWWWDSRRRAELAGRGAEESIELLSSFLSVAALNWQQELWSGLGAFGDVAPVATASDILCSSDRESGRTGTVIHSTLRRPGTNSNEVLDTLQNVSAGPPRLLQCTQTSLVCRTIPTLEVNGSGVVRLSAAGVKSRQAKHLRELCDLVGGPGSDIEPDSCVQNSLKKAGNSMGLEPGVAALDAWMSMEHTLLSYLPTIPDVSHRLELTEALRAVRASLYSQEAGIEGEIAVTGSGKIGESIEDILFQLRTTTDPRLANSIEPLIRPFLALVEEHAKCELSSHSQAAVGVALQRVGRLFCLVGLLRSCLLLPSVPVDPCSKPQLRLNALKAEAEALVHKIFVARILRATPGCGSVEDHSDCGALGDEDLGAQGGLLSQLRRCEEEAEEVTGKAVQRPAEVEQNEERNFLALYRELWRFFQGVGEPAKVLSLLDRLAGGSSGDPLASASSSEASNSSSTEAKSVLHALAEERSWQNSAASFLSQLQFRFGTFADLWTPLATSVFQVREGLRLMAFAVEREKLGREAHMKWLENTPRVFRALLGIVPTDTHGAFHCAVERIRFLVSAEALAVVDGAVSVTRGPGEGSRAKIALLKLALLKAQHLIVLNKVGLWRKQENGRRFESSEIDTRFPAWLAQESKDNGGRQWRSVEHKNLLEVVDRVFGILSSIWEAEEQRQRQRKEDEEAAIKFKGKAVEIKIETEEEEMERKRREYFPEFFSEFSGGGSVEEEVEHLTGSASGERGPTESASDSVNNLSLDKTEIARLAELHHTLFLSNFDDTGGSNAGSSMKSKVPKGRKLRQWRSDNKSSSGAKHNSESEERDALGAKVKFVQRSVWKESFQIARQLGPIMDVSLDVHGETQSIGGCVGAIDQCLELLDGAAHDSGANPEQDHTNKSNLAAQESLGDQRSKSVAIEAEGEREGGDFHHGPWVEELVLAEQPLRALLQRLGVLMREWPENVVLQHLALLTSKIRELPLVSPLARAMAGVETLLRKSNDWEESAPRAYSLQVELQPLWALVKRWRQLELRSWPLLIEKKEKEVEDESKNGFFHLYRLLFSSLSVNEKDAERSTNSEGAEEEAGEAHRVGKEWRTKAWLRLDRHSEWLWKVDTLSEEQESKEGALSGESVSVDQKRVKKGEEAFLTLSKALESFLFSSSVGEFRSRLRLIASLRSHLSARVECEESESLSRSRALGTESSGELSKNTGEKRRLINLLYHLERFYGQFVSDVDQVREACRADVAKKLREHARISRWDEQSYYAMAEASEKAHKTLSKLVRKYEENLKLPISTILERALNSADAQLQRELELEGEGEEDDEENEVDRSDGESTAETRTTGTGAAAKTTKASDKASKSQQGANQEGPGGSRGEKKPSRRQVMGKGSNVLREHRQQLFNAAVDFSVAPVLLTVVSGNGDGASQSSAPALETISDLVQSLPNEVAEVIGRDYERVLRLEDFSGKAQRMCLRQIGKSPSRRSRRSTALWTHRLSVAVISRCRKLQQDESVPRSMKQRALTELLRLLRAQGLQQRRSSHLWRQMTAGSGGGGAEVSGAGQTSPEAGPSLRLFLQLPQPSVSQGLLLDSKKGGPMLETAHPSLSQIANGSKDLAKKGHAATGASGGMESGVMLKPGSETVKKLQEAQELSLWLWYSSDQYYYRSLSTLQRLWFAASAGYSSDLSAVEVERVRGLADHMAILMARQRHLLSSVSEDLDELSQTLQVLSTLAPADGCALPPQSSSRSWETGQRASFINILESLHAVSAFVKDGPSTKDVVSLLRRTEEELAAYSSAEQFVLKPLEDFQELCGSQCLRHLRTGSEAIEDLANEMEASVGRLPIPTSVRSSVKVVAQNERATEGARRQNFEELCAVWTDAQPHSQKHTEAGQDMSQEVQFLTSFASAYGKAVESVLLSVQESCRWLQDKQKERESGKGQGEEESEDVGSKVGAKDGEEGEGEDEEELDEAPPSTLLQSHTLYLGLQRRLQVSKVVEALSALFRLLKDKLREKEEEALQKGAKIANRKAWDVVESICRHLLARLRPLICVIEALANESRYELLLLHQTSSKLQFVLYQVFLSLVTKGFCGSSKEKDEGDEGEKGTNFEDDVEGTGMGEGEGKTDVSDQIEDEEQLLGLKGEEQQEGEKDEKQQDDKGMEMENDFDGEMFDLPEEDEQKDQQNKEEEEEGEELDREMGDLGEDEQQVVDEKLWDEDEDDEEEEGEKKKEKFEKDAPISGPEVEDEMRTKDDEEEETDNKDGSKDKNDGKDEQNRKEEPNEEEGVEDKEPEVNEDREEDVEESHGVGDFEAEAEERGEEDQEDRGGQPEEEEEKGEAEAEAAEELPEEMNLDGGELDGEEEESKNEADEEEEGQVTREEEGAADGEEDQEDFPEEQEDSRVAGDGEDQGQEEKEAEGKEEETSVEPETQAAQEQETQQEDAEALSGDHGVDDASKAEEEQAEKKVEEEEEESKDGEEEKARDEGSATGPEDPSEDRQATGEEREGQVDHEQDSRGGSRGGSTWRPSSTFEETPEDEGRKDRGPRDDTPRKEAGAKEVSAEEENSKDEQQRRKREPNPYQDAEAAWKQWQKRLDLLKQEAEEQEHSSKSEHEEKPPVDDEHKKEAETEQEQDSGGSRVGEAELADDDEAGVHALAPVEEQKGEKDVVMEEEEDKEETGDASQAAEADHVAKDSEGQSSEDGKERNEEEQSKEDEGEEPDEGFVPAEGEDNAVLDQPQHDKEEERRGKSQELEEEESERNMQLLLDDEELAEDENQAEAQPLVVTNLQALAKRDLDAQPVPDEQEKDSLRAEVNSLLSLQRARAQQELEEEGAEDVRERAGIIWSRLEMVTMGLSQRLCEQLRLVLSPTVATKMQGDYRTGKRINMRRVIGYIASQFRKDKIWLRRTKPAKRDYQIMVAIDDSESMADNGAGRLALEAVATICNGLAQLEVGELAVLSFGETVRLLHGFSSPFTSESGAEIVSHFSFSQKKTDMSSTLRTVVDTLTVARKIGGAADLEQRQLVFLVSDGRFDQTSREKIARLIREAEEQKQLIILLIVDSKDEKSSILSTKSVSFVKGKVHMTTYLDNFPFPYYIILKNLEQLPEVLADALRQWFEMLQRF